MWRYSNGFPHDAMITLLWRQNDVARSFWRHNGVIIASCARILIQIRNVSCRCDRGGDCECLCTAIANFAYQCAKKGVVVEWRNNHLCRKYSNNCLYINIYATSHYLDQWWWCLLTHTPHTYLKQNINNFLKESPCENVVCKKATILSWPQCVTWC